MQLLLAVMVIVFALANIGLSLNNGRLQRRIMDFQSDLAEAHRATEKAHELRIKQSLLTLEWVDKTIAETQRADQAEEELELSRRTTVTIMDHYEKKILDGYVMGTRSWIDRAVAR